MHKVSTGCKNFYALTLSKRWGKDIWGPSADRPRTKQPWKDVLKWDKKAKADGIRLKVFCQSMSDFFEDHPHLPEMREEAKGILESLTNIDIQLLTKRPENIPVMASEWMKAWPGHIWIGTSVEDQKTANERIPELLDIPAKVRFLSCEPLLEALDLSPFIGDYFCSNCDYRGFEVGPYDEGEEEGDETPSCPKCGADIWYFTQTSVHPVLRDDQRKPISWVIIGGESGTGARSFHLEWAEDLIQQCRNASVSVFVKQLGRVPVMSEQEWLETNPKRMLNANNRNRVGQGQVPILLHDSHGGNMDEWPEDLRVREFPDGSMK